MYTSRSCSTCTPGRPMEGIWRASGANRGRGERIYPQCAPITEGESEYTLVSGAQQICGGSSAGGGSSTPLAVQPVGGLISDQSDAGSAGIFS
eukprot:8591175-Pyramimonas_sp.AAC.1